MAGFFPNEFRVKDLMLINSIFEIQLFVIKLDLHSLSVKLVLIFGIIFLKLENCKSVDTQPINEYFECQ